MIFQVNDGKGLLAINLCWSSRSSHAVVPSSLLESPRVDPSLGNIVATLLGGRTCLLSDVPIAIEPVVYVKLCKSGFMAEADRVEVKRRSA